ncbi:CPBP family intramembrane glutamic endopeptidase [Oceanobacillus massiliensis]|uniref:CPBP family intramembrane glutamic endopeptidase n=1 Tax=Oceanobacillus massiliensis TaxID=1465765 RepID=UPI0002E47FAC|nr:type II CAAX endopeptidase family protein [Oceanobacillus massiliensis]
MKQSEIIKQLSDSELKKQLFLSQSLFFILSILLSGFLFDKLTDWQLYFQWDITELLFCGVLPGLLIVSIDVLFLFWLSPKYYDDDGINERIFGNRSVRFIFSFTLFVAISEELLFRGVIQNVFGYLIASSLFAFVHLRYLKKPVLFISIMFISFFIGYMYERTNNLLVTITLHFLVDFLLGMVIRYKKRGVLQ